MTKQIIEIDDNTHVCIMGREGKAEKVIIGDDVNDIFIQSRVRDRVSKILYEDDVFKIYGEENGKI